MQANDYKRLGLMQKLLKVAIVLLIIAELAYLLLSMFDYFWGVIGALGVLSARFVLFKFSKKGGWAHLLLMIIPALMIIGPLLYVLVDLFIGTGISSLIDVFLISAFVLPILILFYVSKSLAQIQQRNAPE
ncbi:MAG: hypothetical protein HRU20_22480 [Pseudomonadales bacterium]|nr:hypothetical protein [Pseudomonadales bacterium]